LKRHLDQAACHAFWQIIDDYIQRHPQFRHLSI
jgi:hypothetical protein